MARDLDSVATLSELLGSKVVLSLCHADLSDSFQYLVPLLHVPVFHLLGRRQFFDEFLGHRNMLLHAQLQSVPVLCNTPEPTDRSTHQSLTTPSLNNKCATFIF